jgi:hypothetical protein
MQKWEYLVVAPKSRQLESGRVNWQTDTLNQLGEEGWELIAINTPNWLYLKRPKH